MKGGVGDTANVSCSRSGVDRIPKAIQPQILPAGWSKVTGVDGGEDYYRGPAPPTLWTWPNAEEVENAAQRLAVMEDSINKLTPGEARDDWTAFFHGKKKMDEGADPNEALLSVALDEFSSLGPPDTPALARAAEDAIPPPIGPPHPLQRAVKNVILKQKVVSAATAATAKRKKHKKLVTFFEEGDPSATRRGSGSPSGPAGRPSGAAGR